MAFELPEEILQIIREYSKPITRPDWRTCGQFKKRQFVKDYNNELDKKIGILIYLYPDEEILYLYYKRVINFDKYLEINTYT